jgi:hypothetical protein
MPEHTIETNLERIADALEALVNSRNSAIAELAKSDGDKDVPFHASPVANPAGQWAKAEPSATAVGDGPTGVPQPLETFAPVPELKSVASELTPAPVPATVATPVPATALPFPDAGVPKAVTVPFDDVNGLRAYIIESFSALEQKAPGTGTKVKDVMSSLGFARVDEVPVTQYETLYRGVEAVLQS